MSPSFKVWSKSQTKGHRLPKINNYKKHDYFEETKHRLTAGTEIAFLA